MQVIWQTTLDEKFACQVVRTGDYKGQLTVKDGETVLLDKEVGLAYGAVFGPDVDDVSAWQDACIEAVDGRQT